jgi:hypothetical protein
MVNFKWGIMAGMAALIISVTLGFTHDVKPLHILLRSLVFTVIFFGMGTGFRILVNIYFHELLYFGEDSSPQAAFDKPGSVINITLGNIGDYAVPEKYKDSPDAKELGNIEDLISGSFRPISEEGIDRKREEVYNGREDDQSTANFGKMSFQDSASSETAPFEMPVFTPSFGDDSEDLGGLPDLGSMAMSFGGGSKESLHTADTTSFGQGGGSAFGGDSFSAPISFNEAELMQPNRGNKTHTLPGDFDAKGLAEGIRTVLSRDK